MGTLAHDEFVRAIERLSRVSGDWELRKPEKKSLLAHLPGQTYLIGKERWFRLPNLFFSNVQKTGQSTPLLEKRSAALQPGEFSQDNKDGDALAEDVGVEGTADPGRLKSTRAIVGSERDKSKKAQGDDTINVAIRHEILFHPTYRVPTLGLRAYRSDGSPISLDVAEACLKLWRRESSLALPEAKCYLTPEEHPVHGYPICVLRVCQLQNLMAVAMNGAPKASARLNSADKVPARLTCTDKVAATAYDPLHAVRYLCSWLGIVAPYVGLNVRAVELQRVVESARGEKIKESSRTHDQGSERKED